MPHVVGVVLMRWALLAQVSSPAVPTDWSQLPGVFPDDVSGMVQEAEPTKDFIAAKQPSVAKPAASFRETTIGQLFQGKKTLTPDEAVQVNFWIGALKDLLLTIVAFLPRIIVAGIFFLIFYGLYCGIRQLMLGSLRKANIDPSVRDMLTTVLKWSVLGFGAITACNQVGIQITGLLAGTAIIGLAIGFAAQETLANFIAGVVICWDRPFKVGDWIDVDNRYGQVLRITFRSTRVLNGDGEVIVVPNTMMLASKVTNHSTNPICRVKVVTRIAYTASIDDARERLLSLAAHDSRICAEPAPGVWVSTCEDDGVHLTLGFWVEDEAIQKALQAEYLEKAKKSLEAAGMPMPVRHVHLVMDEPARVGLRRAG
jgi:small conductance mechanosensitive channel